ncbi:hypothetical protein SASPL_156447 [Salvia splendens]|uniref:Uncharacterized protein n=1 Tax=Salvia splendens TaxID=180675 RepID=A0A8X8VWQ6_SALSN|nr:hypothetical protein SASPL_156447 [Salvia splendens]
MAVTGKPMKRLVKRRVTADLSDFLTFPSGGDLAAAKAFRTTVRAFLTKHAFLPPPSTLFPHLLAWQILFRVGDLAVDDGGPAIVCLDVVEEDVARSRSVYCDQCRVVGWSSNPVSAKRYHFIIKADGNSIAGYNKTCAGCGDALHMTDSRCKSCNHVMTTEDVEDWMYQQLDNTTHLLHGVVHANGYGHLLRVNGREGGSCLLSGRHIMNFWDRLCRMLGVRKVSVMDVSKKNGLELRLLHAVVNGHPWLKEEASDTPAGFDIILPSSVRADESSRKKLRTTNSRALCSWTTDDVRHMEEAMFKVLRAVSGSTWVSWHALRGAVCRVGSPELLDYCLKELKGKQVAPGMIVATRCISDSGAMEYRVEPGSESISDSTCLNSFPMPCNEGLVGDLKYFYECLLHPEAMAGVGKREVTVRSATKILDCKQFVKDYLPGHFLQVSRENTVQVLCEVDLMENHNNPPPELMVLSADATIGELKVEAMRGFQDVYLMLRRFEAEEVVGYGGLEWKGIERWIVDCLCGAKDDDGRECWHATYVGYGSILDVVGFRTRMVFRSSFFATDVDGNKWGLDNVLAAGGRRRYGY